MACHDRIPIRPPPSVIFILILKRKILVLLIINIMLGVETEPSASLTLHFLTPSHQTPSRHPYIPSLPLSQCDFARVYYMIKFTHD
jgi:hypothetical protein